MGLKIAMLTSWACRCGIASYSQNLAAALSKAGADVYIVRVPRFGIPRTETFQNVIDSIPTKKIDLIHVQHEYGIWKGHEKTFYPSLKQLGLPVVTTMHSVGSWEVDGTIANNSDRIIVHNEFCFNRFGYPEKTGIIPHGTILINTPPPPESAVQEKHGYRPESSSCRVRWIHKSTQRSRNAHRSSDKNSEDWLIARRRLASGRGNRVHNEFERAHKQRIA